MLHQAPCRSFLILSLVMLFLSLSSANSFIYIECSQPDFTMMTPYESNINSLFNTLLDSASISNFNKSIICYPEYSQSDAVYGLFQCRNDLSSSDCKDCVANSLSQLKTTCPTSTSGKIQLDGCFVKYNITSFFGVVDNMEVSKRCGPSVYNSDVLSRIDDALVLLTCANGQYFRGGGFGSVQGVAQCVQDLTMNECEDCLLEAYRRLRSECETSSSADMYLGNCYIRYADQDNHDGDNISCDCNDDDNHRSKRKKKIKKMKQIRRWAITIGSTIGGVSSVSGLIVSLVILYKIRRSDHKKDRMPPPPINIVTLKVTPKDPSPPSTPPPINIVTLKVTPKDPSPLSTPSLPAGHYCKVVGWCTCPIPPPFTQGFHGQRNVIHGIMWLR